MVIFRRQKVSSFAAENQILKNLGPQTKEQLVKTGKVVTLRLKKGNREEYEIGDKVYLLVEGKAYLSCISSNGKKIITENLEEGDFFGDITIPNPMYKNDCLFLEPIPKTAVTVREFNKEEFAKLLSQDHILTTKVLENFAKRVNRLEQKIEELTLYGLETRVLTELAKLSDPEQISSEQITVRPKVTHEKLAESTGSVRESISKTLKRLKNIGIIFYDKNKNIVISLVKRRKQKQPPLPLTPPS